MTSSSSTIKTFGIDLNTLQRPGTYGFWLGEDPVTEL